MSTEAIETMDRGPGPVASEAIAIGSMTLVAGAAGVASFLHVGLSLEAATSVSVLALSAFMANHLLMARQEARRKPRSGARMRDIAAEAMRAAEATRRDRHELRATPEFGEAHPRLTLAPAPEAEGAGNGAPDPIADAEANRLSEALAQALATPLAREDDDLQARVSSWSYRPSDENLRADPVLPRGGMAAPSALDRVIPELAEPEDVAVPEAAVATPRREPEPQVAPPPAPSAAARSTPPPLPAAVVPKSDESEVISGLLKRLATQIEAGQRDVPERLAEVSPAVAWAREHFGQRDGLESIDDAVDALSSAVSTMRTSLKPKPDTQLRLPLTPDPARERLEAVADAIAAERLEVFLEPILGLRQHRAQHFTVSVRLRTASGESLDAPGIMEAAAGTGLLSVFDALRVKRASRVAGRLEAGQRPGSVFSEITGESMADDILLQDVQRGRMQGEVLPERLVLSFRQEDLRLFSPMQWRTLASLREEGFRFAIEDVTHLGMDFEGLASMGFSFVKLDASVFLQGLPMGAQMLPASDVCRHFAGLGMAVVVTGIGDDAVHARVMGFGALFGQGSLFGAPRPVKATGRSSGSQAVA